MQALELKVPPVAVALLTGVGMYVLAWMFPSQHFLLPGRNLIALILGATGLTVALWGVASFRRAGTTVNPMAPEAASSLVRTGIYRFTRNPMYLGLLLLLGGWAIWLGSVAAWLGLPAFILYMNRFQIRPEEAAMTRMFGADFTSYRADVRRWL